MWSPLATRPPSAAGSSLEPLRLAKLFIITSSPIHCTLKVEKYDGRASRAEAQDAKSDGDPGRAAGHQETGSGFVESNGKLLGAGATTTSPSPDASTGGSLRPSTRHGRGVGAPQDESATHTTVRGRDEQPNALLSVCTLWNSLI